MTLRTMGIQGKNCHFRDKKGGRYAGKVYQGKTVMAPVKNKLSNMKIVQTQMAALWILKV